jgi:sugar phosphate isomerase/epimerase
MNLNQQMNRRDAMRVAGAGLASTLSLAGESKDPQAIVKKRTEDFHGLKIGLASYSTRNLSVEDTLVCCQRAGVKHIALKDAHLKLTTTKEERATVRKKFSDAGIDIVGCGVIYVKNDEAEIRRALEYTKDIGASTAVLGITRDVTPTLDKAVKDFDVRVAIHNHGPADKSGSYSPIEVMEWIKDADKKIGLCMDVGHTFRCGVSPVEMATKYASRLYDVHIKDQADATKTGRFVPLGQGVIDVIGLLKALVKTKYSHHVALEYEVEANNPIPGIAESIGFERGALAML